MKNKAVAFWRNSRLPVNVCGLGRFGLALILPALMLLPACQAPDKLVQANFSQIRPQITKEAEVVQLIGEPNSKLQEYWVYQRPDKHLSVFVEFDDRGVVARTQWVDALGELWEDSDEIGHSPPK